MRLRAVQPSVLCRKTAKLIVAQLCPASGGTVFSGKTEKTVEKRGAWGYHGNPSAKQAGVQVYGYYRHLNSCFHTRCINACFEADRFAGLQAPLPGVYLKTHDVTGSAKKPAVRDRWLFSDTPYTAASIRATPHNCGYALRWIFSTNSAV